METTRILQGCLRAAARSSIARPAPHHHLAHLQTPHPTFHSRSMPSFTSRHQTRSFQTSHSLRSEAPAEAKESDKATQDTTEPPTPDPAAAELETAKKEAKSNLDNWRRSVADYRNLQEQTKREVTKAKEFALDRFCRDLLDSIDNLDRALGTVDPKVYAKDSDATPETLRQDLQNLYEGLKMTERILLGTLKKHGLERFDPSAVEEGQEAVRFDPNRHEATFQAPVEGKKDGDVFYCQSKGFALNGRVLRASKVGVVKQA